MLPPTTNQIDTSVTDTSVLLAAWKYETLMDHVLKITMGPTCFTFLIIAQMENVTASMRTIPTVMFYGGLSYGSWKGLRYIKNSEQEKLEEMRKGVGKADIEAPKIKLTPYGYGFSMFWRSVGVFFAGALITGTLEYTGYGLLKTSDKMYYRAGYFGLSGNVLGFYKGLESADRRHGLPPGSLLTSLLLTTMLYSASEYGFHRTIGKNSIPDYADVLTFSTLYLGYNLKYWSRIISRLQLR